jgi:phosphotransferase system enzyme I (PtsI)
VDEPKKLIRERRCNAEWALVQQMDLLVAQFDEIEDIYLRERKHDILQVVERVVRALLGKPRKLGRAARAERGEDELIVIAHDLSPADTLQFKTLRIGGFVTDLGGATSHTAIVARSLAIPAVVGMHNVRPLIQDDDLLILDGARGVLIVDPDARVLEEYRLRKTQLELERNKRKRLKTARAVTLDGVELSLQANIELPQDVDQAREANAAGVGLFRTEFLFMNRDELPDEDEQFEAYRRVAKAMSGKPVTIRTLDVGADKTARALRGVAHLYDPLHPAVLRLMAQTIQSAQRALMPVAVCGEMAGDPKLTKLLLGMGLRQLSMHPSQLLEVKQQVMMSDTAQLALRVAKMLKLDERDKIAELVEKL